MAKKSETEKIQTAAQEAEIDQETIVDTPFEALKEFGFDIAKWDRATYQIWKPEAGEYVIGEFQKSHPLPDEFKKDDMKGDVMLHNILDKQSDQVISFCGGYAADQAFATVNPKKGQLVYVMYLGQKDTSGNKRVNQWDIRFKPMG